MINQHPDHLRHPDEICSTDPRNRSFDLTLHDMHEVAAKLALNQSVPEDIAVQFETSKNVYLYSWFVYRFYPVARLHALTVLELALRNRFEAELPDSYRGFKGRTTLKKMIQYGKDVGVLQNEAFESHRHRAEVRARTRHFFEMVEYMSNNDIETMEVDESKIEITDEDRAFDTLGMLIDSLPAIRNLHAHGSTHLDNDAYTTLKIVSEIINQLWPLDAGASDTPKNETGEPDA